MFSGFTKILWRLFRAGESLIPKKSESRRDSHFRELKIRRRRASTTVDLVEGEWGEVAVAMAGK